MGNITDPDLVTASDVKIFKPIAALTAVVKRFSGLTGTFYGNRSSEIK